LAADDKNTVMTRWNLLASALALMGLVGSGCAGRHPDGSRSYPRVEFSLMQVAFPIGESRLTVRERQFGDGGLTLVNLHDDEQASVEAAVQVLERTGGRLIELVHSGKRRVEFSWQGKNYNFDPNRIFSTPGVRLTVRGEEPIPQEVYLMVENFAQHFVEYFKLTHQRVLIALHNNDDAGSFSIHSYEPGALYEADTERLHIEPAADPDDFCFVTDAKAFSELQRHQINVVLQDNRIRRDDGSLSVFSGRKGISYINVEAEPEHVDQQIRMVEIAMRILEDINRSKQRKRS
jgi:hypothetical protein